MAGLSAKVPGLGWFGGKYESKLNANSAAVPKENGFPVEHGSFLKTLAQGDHSQWDRSMKNPLVVYPKQIRVPEQTPAPVQVAHTSVSQHSSGLTVAAVTPPAVSPLATLGVFLPSGSRYETHATAGASHLMKHLAFKYNVARSGLEQARELEQLGASLTVSVTREYTSIVSTCLRDHAPLVAATLLPMLCPLLREYEINDAWAEAERELHTSCAKSQLVDALHREAFRGSGLANSQLAPAYNVHHLARDALLEYVRAHWQTARGVVVGVGLEPGLLPALLPELPPLGRAELPLAPAAYTPGEFRQPGAADTHLAVAYPGAGHASADLPALRVLEAVLGAAANPATHFSTPGDGLAGALRTHVLARHAGAHEASAFNFAYSDTGLFGVYARAAGDEAAAVLTSVHRLVWDASRWLTDEAVERGKRAAALRAVRRVESRGGLVEHVGRELLLHQRVAVPDAHWQRAAFDAVSTADVRRVAERLAASQPTVAAIGNVNGLPKL